MIKKLIQLAILTCFVLFSCVQSRDFDGLSKSCSNNLEANATFDDVMALYQGETIQIQEDWIIEGYVVSSDRAGNFFSVIHVQNHPVQPTKGLQVEIDLRDSHLVYEIGSRILIRTKDLYLGKSGEAFKLGGTFSAFGNISVGRLPALKVPEHIFLSCDEGELLQPTVISVDNASDLHINTLVRFHDVEISEDELGLPFAIETEETERTLMDCNENKITLLNSGFSDFQEDILPEGSGTITGVLLKDGNDFQLVIRDLNDIDFSSERCPEIITEFTSTKVFISELADPNNNSGARFLELYNSGSELLDLNQWTLRRYTNANTEVSSTIDLSGFVIAAESTFVIAPNPTEFELVYGFAPDLGVSTNSPADSNGDDNLELVDPFGTVIDVFGVIGEDGSGTDHEFEDGRALRNAEITEGNPNYIFGEWTIFNDTGDAGTIDQPQNAPADFSPGLRD